MTDLRDRIHIINDQPTRGHFVTFEMAGEEMEAPMTCRSCGKTVSAKNRVACESDCLHADGSVFFTWCRSCTESPAPKTLAGLFRALAEAAR